MVVAHITDKKGVAFCIIKSMKAIFFLDIDLEIVKFVASRVEESIEGIIHGSCINENVDHL